MKKFLIEYSPLILFFIGYKFYGLVYAAGLMAIATTIAMIIDYSSTRKINKMHLISLSMILLSLSLTLWSGNTLFLKMKPTILYLIFSLILIFTHFYPKLSPGIQYLLGKQIKLIDSKYWYKLNLRFILFFILMSILNECVWRNFDENVWVNFKVFGSMIMTFIFITTQIPFLMKYHIPLDKKI